MFADPIVLDLRDMQSQKQRNQVQIDRVDVQEFAPRLSAGESFATHQIFFDASLLTQSDI